MRRRRARGRWPRPAARSPTIAADTRAPTPSTCSSTSCSPDRLPLTLVFPSLVPSLGRDRRELAACGRGLGATTARCSAAPTPARTSTSCATPTTRPRVLGESVRDRGLLTLEEAVRELTEVPARLYGLRERGRVARGLARRPRRVRPRARRAPGRTRRATTCPAAASASTPRAVGVEHVLVNGREIVDVRSVHRRPRRPAVAVGRRHRHGHGAWKRATVKLITVVTLTAKISSMRQITTSGDPVTWLCTNEYAISPVITA